MNAPLLGKELRKQFPIFAYHQSQGKALHYLDSAASAQKPDRVIDRLSTYLRTEHANIHRGAYALSAHATTLYDQARSVVASFLNVPSRNIIFTRGATEAINLVAYSLAHYFKRDDCIALSVIEHHSNIVPWQLLAQRHGLSLVYGDCNEDASLNVADMTAKIAASRAKFVSVTELSNSFGAEVPLTEILAAAQKQGALTLVDACQSVVHGSVGPKDLGCDFYCFSGHKLYGPTGVGVLYASDKALALMQPFHGGGDMIESVTLEGSTYADVPQKFEAGTPPIAEVIALGEAILFFQELQQAGVHQHEASVFDYALERLRALDGITCYGPAILSGKGQRSILPFSLAHVHPHDLATICDEHGVQFRAGNHCAMPVMKRLGLTSTARLSFGAYSDTDDVEVLISALQRAKEIFKR